MSGLNLEAGALQTLRHPQKTPARIVNGWIWRLRNKQQGARVEGGREGEKGSKGLCALEQAVPPCLKNELISHYINFSV